jgi:hypothetical protein
MSPTGRLVRHACELPAAACGRLPGNRLAPYHKTRERRPFMANFLFVYRSGKDGQGKMSPEEMQQHMQKWQTWIAEGLQKGWLLDAGDALKKEGRVVGAKKVVTDGPFVESKEIIGGYSIARAEDLDSAAELAKGCPVLLTGGTVEVRPLEGFTVQS